MNAVLLQPAFTDPVLDAQRSFRVALKALSGPGVIQTLPTAHQPPALQGLDSATHALCLALLDLDTPVWLAPAFDTPAIRANIAFHCGSPIVTDRHAARFALLDASTALQLHDFDTGNDRYPDQSCTLLTQLPDLEGGRMLAWSGPGIERHHSVALPLDEGFWAAREARNVFPCGLDVFFISGNRLLGLPRSTRVQECA
ncbi:phosphonate C-P lyase system protein PhnH [Pseudomonas syringae]|jgi:alpha-D-ribose 1-methylphosphonate 5-triphosphate synthase subunit PhnH|uniref:Phosphonate C-P lyase system protein PhnH n=1 Tax=Pseudomonas syringae Cit 7 TaxID=629264 RepID=A0A8T8M3J2_PSESX|nr:phosphonate C-P lyase system protein PhnH [Pseudomonas syringae]MCK9735427.1 phosphonate C-P lyase system protein PhnH [Pseudomonas syringae pv. syringae]MCK9745090.1 phosphonate C-P lyase system protein PhnH [Pseudomonas syringae pv. syringae]PBP56008.1 carbon-phosphorus lyase subunit PhnH [Pseudomonas syringae]QUP68097.1 phosphonate C-P lyase system protein PhnH [Pseudomonas syringae Cit 7]SDS35307.1 alpha-D-ribose 1-methylphosphonate 5-triphosphate synthase subunit PhnH [Pseudomonas syri